MLVVWNRNTQVKYKYLKSTPQYLSESIYCPDCDYCSLPVGREGAAALTHVVGAQNTESEEEPLPVEAKINRRNVCFGRNQTSGIFIFGVEGVHGAGESPGNMREGSR